MLSSGFIVLNFTIRSVIHFDITFVKGLYPSQSVSGFLFFFFSFFFACQKSSCSRIICWKDYPLSIELPLLFFQKSVNYMCVCLLLDSLLYFIYHFIYLCVCSFTNTLLYWWPWFYKKLYSVVAVLQLCSSSVLCL